MTVSSSEKGVIKQMVEVLEHGSRTIVGCSFCGAKLKYAKSDVKQEEVFESQRITHWEKYIICPDCGSKLYIDRPIKVEKL